MLIVAAVILDTLVFAPIRYVSDRIDEFMTRHETAAMSDNDLSMNSYFSDSPNNKFAREIARRECDF